MSRSIYILLLVLLVGNLCTGQSYHNITAEQSARGGALTIGESQYLGYSQPAALAGPDRHTTIHVNAERRYLTQINHLSAGIFYPLSDRSGISALYRDYTLDTYHDRSARISYGRQLSSTLSMGVALQWSSLVIEGYGSDSSPSVSLGLSYHSTANLLWSAVYQHQSAIANRPNEHTIALGMKYRLSDLVSMGAEIGSRQDTEHDIDINWHIDYQVAEEIGLTLGLGNQLSIPSFGIKTTLLPNLVVSVSASRHQTLGASAALSISYTLSGK